MKQIFFKTVNDDYTSVWAIGRFKKTYKVGKRYVFPKEHSAFVYGLSSGQKTIKPNSSEKFPEQSLLDHDLIYGERAESSGNRVIICYGEVVSRAVKICTIGEDWNFSKAEYCLRWTCSDFIVIGEIEPTQRSYFRTKVNPWKVKRISK